MALRLRRGTDAERLTFTPDQGEPVYTTDTKKLYIGDGVTVGGVLVSGEVADGGILAIVEDITPQLGGNLDLNNNNIIGTGNININGTISASGTVNLGDGVEDNVIVGGVIGSNLVPDSDNTWNLGTTSSKWSTIYVTNINGNLNGNVVGSVIGDVTGSLFADDSSVLVDGISQNAFFNNVDVNGTVTASSFTGDGSGLTNVPVSLDSQIFADVIGSVYADDSTLLIDSINGIILAEYLAGTATIDVFGELIGNVTGNLVGDVRGSVFTDNSTVIIDGLTGIINADSGLVYESSVNISQTEANQLAVLSFNNTGAPQYLKVRRTDTGTTGDQNIGLLAFDQVDDTGTKTYVSFAAWHSGLYIGTSSTGTYAASNYIGMVDGSLAVGDYVPTAKLDVRGDAIITGGLTADLTGSVFADDSTLLVDAVNGVIPGYISIAELQTALQDGAGDFAAFKSYILALSS